MQDLLHFPRASHSASIEIYRKKINSPKTLGINKFVEPGTVGNQNAKHAGKPMTCHFLLCALLATSWTAWAYEDGSESAFSADTLDFSEIPALPVPEVHKLSIDSKPPGVQWKTLFNQSLRFLLFENAYRYATEPATRDPDLPYFRGYLDAVGALHGWADGDPFYVNYVGHPMQGAVAGYIWTLNDTQYRNVHFGKDPEYWKSRVRAGAFTFAYSEWTEIGPVLSEAAIGNIQTFFPQQGFVDHVVTPAIGLGWMIAEDALDQYLVRYVEGKTQNRFLRAVVRGAANPSRTLANALAFRLPWDRPRDHGESIAVQTRTDKYQEPERKPGVAPFEFVANAYALAGPSASCAGGGATAAFRISSQWQAVLDVNGCKISGLPKNLTGDSLTYMAGARWTPPISGRLVPYFQVLVGGNKVTQELMSPTQAAYLDGMAKSTGSQPPDHSQYTQQFEHDGFAMAAGTGLDYHFNRALGFRLIGVEYMRSWTDSLQGFAFPNGFQVKAGVVLRMGNW